MRSWIVGQLVLLIGVIGLPGAVRAQTFGSDTFTTQAQAENYLRQSPTGPRAKAAFMAIVEFQLARENPGFSRSDIAQSVNLSVPGRSASPGQTTGNTQRDDGRGDLY
ncbi:hypothetical protein [uncultured Tateyamaria sp.]|uniref:hypothetical protein n=1 Tax=uncultured Tateyamaria sp. TaxID=455651 RepID=UPI00261F8869|nr:hypothetical protein [uncultured Tateyamaria sp.]